MYKDVSISEESMLEIKSHLMDYINENSKLFKNNKFFCFNKEEHKTDKKTTAIIIPDKNNMYWTCLKCGKSGDILAAVECLEGITDFKEKIKFVCKKYNIALKFSKNLKQKTVKETKKEEKKSIVFGTIFENNNCYCRVNSKDIVVEISNFIMKPIYCIEGEDDSQYKCEFICKDNSVFEQIISISDFMDTSRFRKALKHDKLCISATTEQLQCIKSIFTSKNFQHKKGVMQIGFHNYNNLLYFIDGSNHSAIDENMKENDSITLMKGCEELTSEILSVNPITKEELTLISKYLFKFNSLAVTSTILGFCAGLFLKGRLSNCGIKYNHLIIEGQSGSGKNETLDNIILPILNMKNSVLNCGECTNFALNRTACSSNFLPLILDEYKPSKIGKLRVDSISNIMRNAYDGRTFIKGVSSLDKNREFKACTSVILSDESGISETANIERSLRVIFSTSYHTVDNNISLNILKDNRELLNKFGRNLLMGGMKMKEDDILKIHKKIMDSLSNQNITNSRVKNSIANCILGVALINNVFKDLDLNFEENTEVSLADVTECIKSTAVEDLLDNNNCTKSVIDNSLETINRMAVNREILPQYDYDTFIDSSGHYLLKLNYIAFYDRFLKYCHEHSVEHEILPLSSFKKQLSKMSYTVEYNKPTTFKISDSITKEYKTFRAAILDIGKLNTFNIDIDIDFMIERKA